jgi:hypothetical protein
MSDVFDVRWIQSFLCLFYAVIHSVFCLTTGPTPLPKRYVVVNRHNLLDGISVPKVVWEIYDVVS